MFQPCSWRPDLMRGVMLILAWTLAGMTATSADPLTAPADAVSLIPAEISQPDADLRLERLDAPSP